MKVLTRRMVKPYEFDMGWLVLQAQMGGELKAHERLADAGFPALCPHDIVRRRVRSGHRFRIVEQPEPLWPGYLFADADESEPVERLGRVRVLRRGDGSLMVVPTRDIQFLMLAVDASGRLVDATLPENFKARVGDLVEVEQGLLSGFRAYVVALDQLAEHGLVMLKFVMAGKPHLTVVPFQAVGDIVRRGQLGRDRQTRATTPGAAALAA